MKKLPLVTDRNPAMWRNLAELNGDTAFIESQKVEFVEGSDARPDGVSRRSFLAVMGASAALAAGTVGCRRPEEKILPYAKRPEDLIPGNPMFFATSMPWRGSAIGLLAESHNGRPTKIEGNPQHPTSLGATDAFAQATVLDLYDPSRSTAPASKGAAKTVGEADAFLSELSAKFKQNQGKGLGILTEDHRSPTTAAVLDRLRAAMPEAKIYAYEPFTPEQARLGSQIAFGSVRDTSYHFDKANVVVMLDADPLGQEGESTKNARGFAQMRDVDALQEGMSRVYAIESSPSISGTMADHRMRLPSKLVGAFAAKLASALVAAGVNIGGDIKVAGTLPPEADKWAAAIAKDLAANKAKGIVVVGERQPAAVHAIAQLINIALQNVGSTVQHAPAFDKVIPGVASIMQLAADKGSLDTLVILGGNPVFNAPADAGFADVVKGVATTVHLSFFVDETSKATTWHIPRAHLLEGWSDTKSLGGALSIAQPLIAPMFAGMTDAEVVERLLGGKRTSYELVQAYWQELLGINFVGGWRKAVHDGVMILNEDAPVTVQPDAVVEAASKLNAPDGMEVTFASDPHAFDGRFANNGWLQELPDSMHHVTWGSLAAVSPATAQKLGVKDGDLLTVTVEGANASLPTSITPGQADDSVRVYLGQGRTEVGPVGKDIGVNAWGLFRSATPGFAAASVSKGSGNDALVTTQIHFNMEGRPLVRMADMAKYKAEPEFAQEIIGPPLKSPFPDWSYEPGGGDKPYRHKWGMAIDLNKCNGCNACVVACYAENNIPVVGRAGVKKSREMNWLRIDRYFEGDINDPKSVVQPTLCQHCENAPCEQVCPVAATTHSPEGLNQMAYNRCIGTKYCANNCPYKVRRFNYLDYGGGDVTGNASYDPMRQLQFNPDVSVRSRGVIEKCSFCVQRINEAKIKAKVEESRDRLNDGEAVVACQQACPAGAIAFGDLNDPESAVTKSAASNRNYVMLAETNVRPRVSYKARIRNPNPELEQA